MKLIDRIKHITDHMKVSCLLVRGEEFEQVKEAVTKQTRMRPYFDGGTFRCAICDTAVEYTACVPGGLYGEFRDKYCSMCGQRQDWGEDDESND